MRLLIIRHGDPDYEKDSLTEKGWREAELLSRRISRMEVAKVYVSSLGRAKDTASLTLQKMGKTAIECQWLREFWPGIKRPDVAEGSRGIAWDWLPQDWTAEEAYFRRESWADTDIMREGRVGEAYAEVVEKFDAVLAEHGYVREGDFYRAPQPRHDCLLLPFRHGVRAAEPPDEHLTHDTLAPSLRRPFLCDHGLHGGALPRESHFPRKRFRRHLPSVRGGGGAFLLGQVLRDL
jgi:probable phosphoglycerate mutase